LRAEGLIPIGIKKKKKIDVNQWNLYLSPLKFCPWRGVLYATLCDKVYQSLATGRRCSLFSSTNKTDHHDVTKIVLKVALNSTIITLTMKASNQYTVIVTTGTF
jgi:hypothetical protein